MGAAAAVHYITISHYLCLVALLVMAHGITLNMFQASWRAMVIEAHKTQPNLLTQVYANQMTYQGIFAIVYSLHKEHLIPHGGH